jgi:flagellar export protein FliJ
VGEVDPAALRHHAAAGVGLFRKAQRTVLEIASLEKGIAKARAESVEAARARRTLEILREQRLAAFRALENRREQGALDEIATTGASVAARGALPGVQS